MEKIIRKRRSKVVVIAAFAVLICTMALLLKKNEKVEGKQEAKDQWINVELTYLGSAISEETTWLLDKNHDIKKFTDIDDNNLEYAIMGYVFFSDFEYFNNYIKKMEGICDENFTVKEQEEMKYVCIYGRKMEWLQYNPGRKSISGAYANRAGIDWEMEQEQGCVYFYEFQDPGFLADMSLEVFYDKAVGKVYFASDTERHYSELPNPGE